MESIIAAHDEAACSDEEVDVEEEPLFSEASSSSKNGHDLYQRTGSNSDLSESESSSDEEEPEVPTT